MVTIVSQSVAYLWTLLMVSFEVPFLFFPFMVCFCVLFKNKCLDQD